MGYITVFKEILKRDDVGDVFTITFDEDPEEFSFDNIHLTCIFNAKHLQLPGTFFSGSCIIDSANLIVTYIIASGQIAELGRYLFEFQFSSNTSLKQTFPKDTTLFFDVIQELKP